MRRRDRSIQAIDRVDATASLVPSAPQSAGRRVNPRIEPHRRAAREASASRTAARPCTSPARSSVRPLRPASRRWSTRSEPGQVVSRRVVQIPLKGVHSGLDRREFVGDRARRSWVASRFASCSGVSFGSCFGLGWSVKLRTVAPVRIEERQRRGRRAVVARRQIEEDRRAVFRVIAEVRNARSSVRRTHCESHAVCGREELHVRGRRSPFGERAARAA